MCWNKIRDSSNSWFTNDSSNIDNINFDNIWWNTYNLEDTKESIFYIIK